jgi:hypothetical protein
MESFNRRHFIGVMGGGAASILTGAVVAGLPKGLARAQAASLSVEVAITALDTVREAADGNPFPTGPFYVQGALYEEGTLSEEGIAPDGAASIGTFRCWGWLFDGQSFGAAVSQAYELDGRGIIYTHGREGLPNRAITGGLDEFENARGTVNAEFINPANFSFRAAFNIT